MKAQLLVEFETGQIIATAVACGTMHDFKLLKHSRLPFVPSQLCLADRGYQGFAKRHQSSVYSHQEATQPTVTKSRQTAQSGISKTPGSS
ncbi:transposase [Trichocoleus sp. AS-A1]|nr:MULTISPECIES: transposase [unclassified Coleofasciculus]